MHINISINSDGNSGKGLMGMSLADMIDKPTISKKKKRTKTKKKDTLAKAMEGGK